MLAVTTIPIPVLIGIAVVLLVLVRGVKIVQQARGEKPAVAR